ncbi:MAG: hypothetical protein A2623_10615 [Caulobacterales bacterium RIFCSPHIGHO2_01_FULL_70_19]|nr:MAG: hypothetical protein A2623_10615 [Caulobacterales bacterium RIFCSPHIGHO2_01_FULL_70_19]
MNRIQLAPDGGQLFLWRSRAPGSAFSGSSVNRALVAPASCIEADGQDCGTRIDGAERTEFVGWGPDATSLFVRRGSRLFHLGRDGSGPLQVLSSADLSIPDPVDLGRIGVSQSTGAAAEAAAFEAEYRKAQSASGNRRIERLELGNAVQTAWLVREAGSRLSLRSGDRVMLLEAGLRPEIYGPPSIARTERDVVAFRPGWSSREDREPYEQSILDPDGREAGTFTPRGVALTGVRSWLDASVRAYLAHNRDLTIDDVAVATGSQAYLLLRGVRNTTRLVKITPGSTSELTCARGPRAPAAPEPAWDVESLQTGGRRIAFNHFRSGATSRGLVVYFHGGPSGSLRDSGYLATVRNYAGMGYDVLAVDGLGSRDSGPRAMEDLRTRGLEAVRDDARAVAAHVRQVSPASQRIIIHGESFGAVQALATSALLKPASLVLVVPWLNHRPPGDILDDAAQVRSQIRWETAVFGPRDAPSSVAFREDLSSLTRARPLGRSALVIFAEGDRVSRPDDIALGDAEVVVLRGASHALVMSMRPTWKHIADHIERPAGQDGR